MDNLILSKSHRFENEIKIIKKGILLVNNDIILYSKNKLSLLHLLAIYNFPRC